MPGNATGSIEPITQVELQQSAVQIQSALDAAAARAVPSASVNAAQNGSKPWRSPVKLSKDKAPVISMLPGPLRALQAEDSCGMTSSQESSPELHRQRRLVPPTEAVSALLLHGLRWQFSGFEV